LADGRRQPRPTAPLAALARDLPGPADCRFRPPFLFFKGARWAAGEAFCPAPRIGVCGAPAGGDEAAGLGVLPQPARSSLGDPASRRAKQDFIPEFQGAET